LRPVVTTGEQPSLPERIFVATGPDQADPAARRNRRGNPPFRPHLKENDMIKWAIIFAIIAIVAGLLGFGGIAGAAAGIAKFLAVLALIIFAVFLVLGFTVAKKVT
jgi:uncharacterized membrane protein YtjA (UPF0391 family)